MPSADDSSPGSADCVLAISLSESGLAVGLSRSQPGLLISRQPTSSIEPSLAVNSGHRIDTLVLDSADRHSENLLPAIDELLLSCGCTLHELDGIAFEAGPGGFTRVRVACAVAQGLAFGAGLKLRAVDSLEAIALATADEQELLPGTSIAVCTDARMGECYVGRYRIETGGLSTLHAADLIAVDQLSAWLTVVASGSQQGSGALLPKYLIPVIAGDGLTRHPQTGFAGRLEIVGMPDASALVRAVLMLATAQAHWVAPDRARPLYVRHKVALNVEEQVALRAARALGRDGN